MKWDKAGHFSATHFSEAGEFPQAQAFEKIDGRSAKPVVFVVDDEYFSRSAARLMLEEAGLTVEDFADCETFIEDYHPREQCCLLLDVRFPGMGGLELLVRLQQTARQLPTIVMSGRSEISEAVRFMKSGATDFMEKPLSREALLGAVRNALQQSRRINSVSLLKEMAVDHLANLTPRQREIMNLVLAGHPSKNIAGDLGISQRTVENHRASIMHKTGATSLPALARLVIAASPYSQRTAEPL